jgi:RNA polymerase sigma factor (sigma-70 family)
MTNLNDSTPGLIPRQCRFATTQWSIILAAADRKSPRSQEALAELCSTYWYPLYTFARRQGQPASQAEDLTQEFFVRLLEKSYLSDAEPERGRFRTFLLVCFKRFLANDHDRSMALKRGGDRKTVPLDFTDAESRYRLEPAHSATPERIFERRWALTLLDQVLTRLADEYRQAGKGARFDQLKVFLVADSSGLSYSDLAARLQLSEGAIKVAVHRLRQRYGQLLTSEVARTLERPADATDEIQRLFAVLREPRS